jgi:hypothetical protein
MKIDSRRIAIVFAGAALLAAAIGAVANLANFSESATTILGAAAIALVAAFGAPWVLGWRMPLRPAVLQDRHVVQTHEPTVFADEAKDRIAARKLNVAGVLEGRDQHELRRRPPGKVATRWAIRVRTYRVDRRDIRVDVGHGVDPTSLRRPASAKR